MKFLLGPVGAQSRGCRLLIFVCGLMEYLETTSSSIFRFITAVEHIHS